MNRLDRAKVERAIGRWWERVEALFDCAFGPAHVCDGWPNEIWACPYELCLRRQADQTAIEAQRGQ